MRKLLIFIIAFLPVLVLEAKDMDSSVVKYLQDYASFGATQLKQQTLKNLQNDMMGISHENNYVLNFSEMPPRIVGNVSDHTEDLRLGQQYNTTDPDYFDATECGNLNAYLQSLNALIPQGKPKIYIAVNLRLGIIATQTDLASVGNLATFGNEIKTTGDAFDKLFSIQLKWQTETNIEQNLDNVKTQFAQSNQGSYALFYWGKFFEIKAKSTTDNTGASNVLAKVSERGWYKYHFTDFTYTEKYNLIRDYIINKSHFDVLPRTTKQQLREKLQAGSKSLADAIINLDGISKEMDFLKRVVDYTGRSNGLTTQQQEALAKLLGGQNVIKDVTGTDRDRHTLKCKLFITKEGDPNNSKILTQISTCDLVSGEAAINIHFTGNTPSVKSVKFGDSDTQAAFEGVIRNLGQTKESFWASFLGNSDWQGVKFEDLCAGIYEAMDWASKNIEKAKIPEYVWNCDKAEYNAIYSKVFGGLFKPMTFLVDNAINPFVSKFAPQFSGREDQAKFAMLCGVWNGLIDAFKAIPDGVALLSSMGSNNPKHKAAINALSDQISQNGGGMKGFFVTIWEGLKTAHNPNKPCEFAHQIGSDVFVIITAYFTGGESLANSSIGNSLKTVLTTLDRLDIIGQATGLVVKATTFAGKWSIKLVSGTGKAVFQFVDDGFSKVIQIADAAGTAFKDIDWALARTYQMIGLDGKSYTYTVLRNPLDNLNDAIVKMKEILKDGEGKPIQGKNGEVMAKCETASGKETVAAVKEGGTVVSQQIDDLVAAIKNNVSKRVEATGWSMIYSEREIKEIVENAKKLNLTDKEIEDFIFIGCRSDKTIKYLDLIEQFSQWLTVKQRGFPFRFNTLVDYQIFSQKLIQQLKDYGINTADVRIQGSALRTPNAKDIDIAIFVSESEFNSLATKMEAGIRSRTQNPLAADNLITAMKKQIADGRINSLYFDRINADLSFMKDFYEFRKILATSTSPSVDISLILKEKNFDVSPYLNIK